MFCSISVAELYFSCLNKNNETSTPVRTYVLNVWTYVPTCVLTTTTSGRWFELRSWLKQQQLNITTTWLRHHELRSWSVGRDCFNSCCCTTTSYARGLCSNCKYQWLGRDRRSQWRSHSHSHWLFIFTVRTLIQFVHYINEGPEARDWCM